MILFIDATITATYFHYGETKTKEIVVNGLESVDKGSVLKCELNEFLITKYGAISHGTQTWERDKVDYEIKYRTVTTII